MATFLKTPVAINKPLIIIFGLLALILAGSGWFAGKEYAPGNIASLTVDFGDGRVRMFEGEAVDGMTVAQALAASAQAGRMQILSRTYAQASLLSIEDRESVAGDGQWVVFRNGTKVQEPLEQARILPGDALLLRFE